MQWQFLVIISMPDSIYTQTHICTHTYIHKHTHTHIYMYIFIRVGPDKREQMNIRRAALVKSLKRKKMLNKVKVAGSMLSTQRKLRRTTFVQAPTLALLTEKEKTGASGSSDKEEEKERMQMREFQVTNTKYQFVWSAFQQFNDKQRLSRAASKNENTVQSRPISSTAVIPSSSSSSSSPPDVTNFVVGLEANRKYKTKESTPEAQVHTANLRKTSVITRSNCVLARVHLGAFMTLLCDLVDPPLKNYGNIMKFLHTQIHARSSDDAMMLIDVFKEHAFFKAHNSDTVVQLAQFATYHKVQAQDIIYKQGDMSAEDCLYVVLSGSISKHVMFERDDEPVKMYADDDELDNTLGDDDEGHTFLTGVIDGAEEDDDKDDEAEREIMNKERRKAKERAELYARLTDVRSIDDIEELFGPCHELVSSGHCFGEMALVGRSKREATLIARGPVELIAVSKAAYRKVTTSSNDNANQLANSGEDELNHEADDSEAGSRSQFALSDSQRPLQLARVIKILNEEEPLYRTPVSIMFLERQLKRFPLFRAMTPQMRIFIYQRMTHRRVKKQHILYREGDEGKDLRLILQGSVGLHERDFVAVQILLWRHRARLRIRNRVEEEDKRISEETHILLRELRRRDSVVDISASLGDIDECEVADIEDQREVENETDYVNTAIKRPQSSNINGEGSNSDDSDETSDMPSLERLSTFTQELDNNPRNHSESLLHNIDDQMKNARRKSRSFSRKFNYIHNKKKRRAR